MSLTETLCLESAPLQQKYRLNDGDGLYLEIFPNGQRFWRLRYRYYGKENIISLGRFPETSIEDARALRNKAKDDITKGLDPALLKKEVRQLAKYKASQTFEQIAKEWHDHNRDTWTERHADYIWRRLILHVFPEIGHYPLHMLKSSQVLACLQKVEKHAPDIARRLLNISSRIFHYAGVTGRAESDLTFGLKGALKKYRTGHYASIDIVELPDLLVAIHSNEARLYRQTNLALRLMLLTFVRTSELINSKWAEFDFNKKLWIIPAERMKMRKPHIVPLSRQALEILQTLKELNGRREHVFPSVPRPRKPMSNATILVALKRLGYHKKMTGHGFRALAMGVIKEKLKYRHEVVDRQLAHEPKGNVNRAYDRAAFLDDRIIMMQEYADYLDKVLINQQTERLSNEQRSNVPVSDSGRVFKLKGSFTTSTSQSLNISEWNKSGPLSITH